MPSTSLCKYGEVEGKFDKLKAKHDKLKAKFDDFMHDEVKNSNKHEVAEVKKHEVKNEDVKKFIGSQAQSSVPAQTSASAQPSTNQYIKTEPDTDSK